MDTSIKDAVEFFDLDMQSCTDALAIHHWQTLTAFVLDHKARCNSNDTILPRCDACCEVGHCNRHEKYNWYCSYYAEKHSTVA